MTTATAPRLTVRVPSEGDFGGADFLPDASLDEIGGDLIEMYPNDLGHLADVTISYLWRRKGGKKAGAPIMGKAVKPSGLLTAFTTAEAVIWLAADHVDEAEYTQRQIQALVFHEMSHVWIEEPDPDDEGGARKIVMRGHDFEGFKSELRAFGAWEEMLQEAASAFKQAGLFA